MNVLDTFGVLSRQSGSSCHCVAAMSGNGLLVGFETTNGSG